MNCIVCLLCLIAATGAEAKLFVPSITAVGADADTEVVVQGFVDSSSSLMIDITLSNPCSSNTVLLAFGKDVNADGELSTEEINYQVGWDAGVWVEHAANAVDSVSLELGLSGNRLLKFKAPGDWDTVNLIVRGSAAGKVFAGKAPTLILIR
jgi:hypothetical protein